jgi:uncharacterized protein YdiU (UPF0061 family)
MQPDLRIPFDNRYARLPERFHARVAPTPVSSPRLIAFNRDLAAALGLVDEGAGDERLAALFSGNALPDGAEPIAQVYCGHQFGQLNPRLGDGRAILLGEVIDREGRRRDIQLKGAGRTPFSRGGDGRSPLGPVIREYLVSEAMHALRIPTTRALAAVASGDTVRRETPEPGAIFTRVAASHIRIGTFQYFALQDDREALAQLVRHVAGRHYADIDPDRPQAPLQLLEAVCRRQADLVARWMLVGFVHGVMNTDNMTVSGETIDYGPCAFMDRYDPESVFSYIDQNGRYAWRNQPGIAQWNLARFAESLLPLIDTDENRAIQAATGVLERFRGWHNDAWLAGMRPKLGLTTAEDGDAALADRWLSLMHAGQADYTLFFRTLSHHAPATIATPVPDGLQGLLAEGQGQALQNVWQDWCDRCSRDPLSITERNTLMQAANPALIPRNHRIAEAIAAATQGDYTVFARLHRLLQDPWVETPENVDLQQPPTSDQRVCTTFCGT